MGNAHAPQAWRLGTECRLSLIGRWQSCTLGRHGCKTWLYKYIYMYVYMYIYIHTHTYTYTHTHTHIYIYIYCPQPSKKLTSKQLEMETHWCIRATETKVLIIFIVLERLHSKILHLQWTTTENEIGPFVYGLNRTNDDAVYWSKHASRNWVVRTIEWCLVNRTAWQ